MYNGAIACSFSVTSCAQGLYDAFCQQSSTCADVSFPIASPMFWEPPHVSWFKLNCDVAVNAQQGMGSYGVVTRNHEGLVMLSGADIGVYSNDFNVAEA